MTYPHYPGHSLPRSEISIHYDNTRKRVTFINPNYYGDGNMVSFHVEDTSGAADSMDVAIDITPINDLKFLLVFPVCQQRLGRYSGHKHLV